MGEGVQVPFAEMTGWVENLGRDVQLLVCSSRGFWSLNHLDTLQGIMKTKKKKKGFTSGRKGDRLLRESYE